MKILFLLLIFLLGVILIYIVSKKGQWKRPESRDFDPKWKNFLLENIPFYEDLNTKDRIHFEFKILEFLENIKVTGIKTTLNYSDKLLVASSAIIPIFRFPNWQYKNLDEVLIYPNSFNHQFELEGKERSILGMVGNGYMEGKMILSRQSLRHGFKNEKDKNNTAIHEFVHLIDKADGIIDGIPSLLLQKQYIIPWLQLIESKIKEIELGKSDIKPYGGTSRIEFFAVLGEYFFERPHLLKDKHPELYKLLSKIFLPEEN